MLFEVIPLFFAQVESTMHYEAAELGNTKKKISLTQEAAVDTMPDIEPHALQDGGSSMASC
jgi:hypothetical protein